MKSKAKQPRAPEIPAALAAKSRRAIELHQQGHLAEAERLYRQILTAMPMHFDALHLLGVIKAQQNEFAAAVPFFEQALRVNPASASAFNNFGNVLHALGRYDQALASYDRSLALRADNPKALMHRGNALRKLQRPDEALASYDRALRLRPDYAEALIHRGGALTEMGRYDEAVAAYRQALASGGDAPRIMYSLACLGAEAVPKASPVEYVKGLFDQYADAFDEHLVEALEYKTPTFLVDATARARGTRRGLARCRGPGLRNGPVRTSVTPAGAHAGGGGPVAQDAGEGRVSAAATTSSSAPRWRPIWPASRSASTSASRPMSLSTSATSPRCSPACARSCARRLVRLFGRGRRRDGLHPPAQSPLRPFARLPAPVGRGSRVYDRIGWSRE